MKNTFYGCKFDRARFSSLATRVLQVNHLSPASGGTGWCKGEGGGEEGRREKGRRQAGKKRLSSLSADIRGCACLSGLCRNERTSERRSQDTMCVIDEMLPND